LKDGETEFIRFYKFGRGLHVGLLRNCSVHRKDVLSMLLEGMITFISFVIFSCALAIVDEIVNATSMNILLQKSILL